MSGNSARIILETHRNENLKRQTVRTFMSKRRPIERLRNIGIMAHIDAGKTTTTERFLFYTGKTHRMGEVDDGASVMDWMVQEKERGITITSAATTCFWNDYQINIIDTPGHVDFTAEVERSLRVLDGAIAIFCAVGGVEPQSETVWKQANKYDIPRIAYVNKMDRMGADFENVLTMMADRLKAVAIPIQLPVGAEDKFTGIIDLIEMNYREYDGDSLGSKYFDLPIPNEYVSKAEVARHRLLETISEFDDELMDKYLREKEIEVVDIKRALRAGTLQSAIVPVLCGSSFHNIGVQKLLDAIIDYLPAPSDLPPVEGINPKTEVIESRAANAKAPFSALAFKVATDPFFDTLVFFRVYSGTLQAGKQVLNTLTGKKERISRILEMHANKREDLKEVTAGDIAAAVGLKYSTTGSTFCDERHPISFESMVFPEPVIYVAIEPKTKADQEKLGESLKKLSDEDPTFRVNINEDTGQTIISGMGELHLEIIIDRLTREFNVGANVGRPQVAYKETISMSGEAEGKFIRQSGGRGQYGKVTVRIEPLKPGEGFIFEDASKGGVIPREFIKAIELGISEAMGTGLIGGYPIVDVKATLLDGGYHEVDSSELAFRIAASMAFKEAVKKSKPVLMEPTMNVEVVAPETSLGTVIQDLNSRRGSITGMFDRHDGKVLSAQVPLSEMFGYATQLRNITQGRGLYTMEFSHYQPVPEKVSPLSYTGMV